MNEVKVSVLTYVLNGLDHIEKCIYSILNQSLQEIEIVVIDGGSTDGTLEALNRLQKIDSRIRVLSSDLGVGRQFNTGLMAARGEYIGICESDDCIKREMYKREYELAKKYELDFVLSDYEQLYEVKGVNQRIMISSYHDESLYENLICPSADERILKVNASGFWSGIYKRQFLIDNNIFMNETPGASYQDTSFSFLTKVYAKRAWIMKEAFYEYRMDNAGSSTNDPKRLKAIFAEYDLLEERLKKSGIWEQYKEFYIRLRILGTTWFYGILSANGKKEYLPVLRNDIISVVSSDIFYLSKLDGRDKEIVNAAKTSSDCLKEILSVQEEYDPVLKSFENSLISMDPKKYVIIFGAGKLGEKLWLYLLERGIEPVAFVDNDPVRWNGNFCSTEVDCPIEAAQKYRESIWIIASIRNSEIIRDQLTKMGIEGNKILICPGNLMMGL